MQEAMYHLLVGIRQHVCENGDIDWVARLSRDLTDYQEEESGESCPTAWCMVMQTLMQLWADLVSCQDLKVVVRTQFDWAECLYHHYLTLAPLAGSLFLNIQISSHKLHFSMTHNGLKFCIIYGGYVVWVGEWGYGHLYITTKPVYCTI